MIFAYDVKEKTFSFSYNLCGNKETFTCDKNTKLTKNEFQPLMNIYIVSNVDNGYIPDYVIDGSLSIYFDKDTCLDFEALTFKTDKNGCVKSCELYFRDSPKNNTELSNVVQKYFDPVLKYNEQYPSIMKDGIQIILEHAKSKRSFINIRLQ